MASLIPSFSSSNFLVLKSLFLFLIPISSSFVAECQSVQKHGAALFIFGDSFFDPGNNNFINTTTLDKANFWPYGETFFKFPTGRFSDGRLVSDFIAQYAKLPLIPPYLQPDTKKHYKNGVNFASAGAGALVETFQGAVINLRTQLKYYRIVEGRLMHKLGNAGAKMKSSSGVYLFSIGSNDYMSLFLTNSTILNSLTKPQYVGMVIGNLTSAILEVYTRGGRKFGFLNVGPLGCSPGLRILEAGNNGGCLEEASTMAKLHNEALEKKLLELKKQLKGFQYSLYDFNNTLTQLINHPSTYGFKDGKTACCGTGRFRGTLSCGGKRPVKEFQLCHNPNEYVFWDSYHLTQKAYKLIADQMWAGGPLVVKPLNLKYMFQCDI